MPRVNTTEKKISNFIQLNCSSWIFNAQTVENTVYKIIVNRENRGEEDCVLVQIEEVGANQTKFSLIIIPRALSTANLR